MAPLISHIDDYRQLRSTFKKNKKKTTMATSVQVLSKRKPYLKPHVQLEPRGFLEGYFEGVPHGVPRLQELGPKVLALEVLALQSSLMYVSVKRDT